MTTASHSVRTDTNESESYGNPVVVANIAMPLIVFFFFFLQLEWGINRSTHSS